MHELGRILRNYCATEYRTWARELPRITGLISNAVHDSTSFASRFLELRHLKTLTWLST